MQTSVRSRDPGASFAARKGHVPQLSISDDRHHVTETIGYMYGDDDDSDSRRDSDPLNYHTSPPLGPTAVPNNPPEDLRRMNRTSLRRKQLAINQTTNEKMDFPTNGSIRPAGLARGNSWDAHTGQTSPTLGSLERPPSETATTQFPLNDIDYESSPAAVAQELSNLQALRRMSMNVTAPGDPDLPTLNPAAIPSSPSASDNEDDSSRLFWVPARLHPELAPTEFRTFLEGKAEQIRRRSGELSSFSTGSSVRSSSSLSSGTSGLQRKKSMLSRQIDNPNGYQDGAERLERKRSGTQKTKPTDPNLQDLEALVGDGSRLQRLSLDSQGDAENGDIILPSIPGSSLKRSTRTTYRRGGSVKGRRDPTTYAQRAARRAAAASSEDASAVTQTPEIPPMPSFPSLDIGNLAQTLRDPSAPSTRLTTNFSRPAGGRSPSPPDSVGGTSLTASFDSMFARDDATARTSVSSMPETRSRKPQYSGPARASLDIPPQQKPVPQIVESPPSPDEAQSPPHSMPAQPPTGPTFNQQSRLPERTSSREDPRIQAQRPAMPPKQAPSIIITKRPPSQGTSTAPQSTSPQSLDQMSAHPAALPGNDTTTTNLSFIPTLTEDKRADNKRSRDKKDESKKSGWGWLLGKEETEKEKKADRKAGKQPEKYDNTRLDVLQTSIDGGPKGRESIVLDRESLKLEEERKKESQRKSAGSDMKKEKEGLFSSIFGGGKRNKSDKDAPSKKHLIRGLSPEPPYRPLKPDIDYNWTRFSILEERAIYRMAHIKLANPRRALYSQVLLSNFMYSYLAKVQQMHPQMNLPTSAVKAQTQKKGVQQASQQQAKDQPDEFTQYQKYQQQQQQQQQQPQQLYSPQQELSQQSYNTQQDYDGGDNHMYNYDVTGQRPKSRGSKHSPENSVGHSGDGYGGRYAGSNQQSSYEQESHQGNDEDDDEMW